MNVFVFGYNLIKKANLVLGQPKTPVPPLKSDKKYVQESDTDPTTGGLT